VTVRTIAISALLATSVPLAAQLPSPGGADPLRTQIMTFEDALRRAIEIAGEGLSEQVRQQLKTPVPIQFGFVPAVPVVRGWPLESYGYHFDVQVPDVAANSILVWRMWEDSRPGARMPDGRPAEGPARPVADGGAIVKDDPMVGVGGTGRPVPAGADFEPVAVYRANVRAALIDAIINNPGVLSLRDTDVVAVSAATVRQSAAYRLSSQSTRLTLYIRGADLAALRDGRLTREQARQRITEKSF
jgi:hypothetical protein